MWCILCDTINIPDIFCLACELVTQWVTIQDELCQLPAFDLTMINRRNDQTSNMNYFSSNSSHKKSREYQRVYRNRSVGAETPDRLVVHEVLHKFSLGYSRFCGDCDSLDTPTTALE